MKKFKILSYFVICLLFFVNTVNAIENKILFKVNNEIITSLDIFNELKYLEIINKKLINSKKKQAFEIAKKSLIREKIKEIELRKVIKEIKLDDQYLNDILINYFKEEKINNIKDFNDYFITLGINPNQIKKKISIEILWNQLIYKKYNKNVKINKQNIINELKKNNQQTQFLLSEILFSLEENEKLDDKFDLIKEKISKSSFSEAALVYSISDTANKSGKLGWINETSLSDKIRNILKNMDKGSLSDPIVIPGGFLIINIEDIRKVKNENSQAKIEKLIKEKTNKQLNQYSNIFFNKVQKNIIINEL